MKRFTFLRAAGLRTRDVVAAEWRHLTRFSASDRPWLMPLAAALASGLPIFVAAYSPASGRDAVLQAGLLAEASRLGATSHEAVMMARLMDTLIGCAVGLAGGVCLHNARLRAAAGAVLRRLVPRPMGL